MKAMQRLGWRCAVLGALTLTLCGCAVVGDAFSPSLFSSLGIDPGLIQPAQGSIVVAFRNTTQSPAIFYAFKATNAASLTSGARNFSVEVQPGQVGNEVLDCPVGLIVPGSYTTTGDGSTTQTGYSALAATLTGIPTGAGGAATTATADVTYGGAVLLSGADYSCGDVVEIQIIDRGVGATTGQTGQAGQTQGRFVIAVQVIPGA